MFARIEQLTRQMDRRPPAAMPRLLQYLAIGTFAPPRDYLEFMSATDGSEGPIGNAAYLAIYSVDEMIDCNDMMRTVDSQLIFFGTNRGGEGYAFDLQRPEAPIIAIEFDTLDRTYAKDMGSTFLEFLETLRRREGIVGVC